MTWKVCYSCKNYCKKTVIQSQHLQYHDDEYETRVNNDPKHSQWNSQLVSEKENKAARMAQPFLNPIENKN